jgi:DNA-directed RNA polymerase subunit beta'
MADIRLTEPVIPPWYLKGTPSRLSLFLDIDPEELKDTGYSEKWIVTDPGEPKASKKLRSGSIITTRSHINNMKKPDVKGYAALSGGEAVQMLIEQMLSTKDNPDGKTNLQMEYDRLKSEGGTDEDKARLEVLEYFIRSEQDPRHMLITVFPVVPPSFRPAGSILESRYLHFAAISLPDSRYSRRNRSGGPERLTADPKKAINSKGLYQVCARRLITEMAFRSEL